MAVAVVVGLAETLLGVGSGGNPGQARTGLLGW